VKSRPPSSSPEGERVKSEKCHLMNENDNENDNENENCHPDGFFHFPLFTFLALRYLET